MGNRKPVKDVLLEAGLVDEMQLKSALGHVQRWGKRLARVVVDHGFTTEDEVVNALTSAWGIQRVHLGGLHKDPAALAKLEPEFCEEHAVFPMALRDGGKTLLLAMADPTDLTFADEVGRRTRTRVVPALAGEGEIHAVIQRLYRQGKKISGVTPPRKTASLPDESGEDAEMTEMSSRRGNRAVGVAPAAPSSNGAAFTAEALEHLRSIVENQEKSRKVLRAVTELLVEKGCLTAQELATRSKS